jgi:hypothetical protein
MVRIFNAELVPTEGYSVSPNCVTFSRSFTASSTMMENESSTAGYLAGRALFAEEESAHHNCTLDCYLHQSSA